MAALAATAFTAAQAQELIPAKPGEKQIEFKGAGLKERIANRNIDPTRARASQKITQISKERDVLHEDFEGWDKEDSEWLPEGWSKERKVIAPGHNGWRAYAPLSGYEDISSKCMVFDVFNEPVDEWLITPEVKVADGMQLTWTTYISPLYYFDPDYIDYESFTFNEMHIINDVHVNISTDGGESWEMLKSIAEEFEGMTGYFDLYRLHGLRTYTIDLTDYAGKDIAVAFQVVGEREGNTAMVDDVIIGYPSIDVAYARPYGALFFGLTDTDEYVPASIMAVPVYSPVTYENISENDFASYIWSYEDTDGMNTSNAQDALTVTYRTNYESDFTSRNNLYEMPTLRAEADKHSATEFTYPYYVQAGGRGEYERYFVDSQTYELIDLDYGVSDPITEGVATWADIVVPYFGYNQESDRYWSDIMFDGDPDLSMDDDNYSHLVKHGNLFFATDEPLVISGIRAHGYGRINPEARLTAEIYLVGDDFVIPEEPYVTAICTGDAITMVDRYATNYILTFNFSFDQPVVMSSDLSPYYFVAIGGFHDAENVEYYSPAMSATDSPDGMALGWFARENKLFGEKYAESWSPVYYYTNQLVSFYIGLDAVFPWLEAEQDEVETYDGVEATLNLDSYYRGNELTIKGLPEWLTAQASGRYGLTKVVFTSNSTEEKSATVSIEGPGVSKMITVKNTSVASVDRIDAADLNGVEEIYTLSGLRVNGDLVPGIYIVKRADGKVSKIYVK